MLRLQIHNVQNAGFRAAIVYNDDDDDGLIVMGSTGSFNVAIPSVFVGATTGAILLQSIKYGGNRSCQSGMGVLLFAMPTALGLASTTVVTLTPDKINKWPSFLVLFIVLLAALIFSCTVYIVSRFPRAGGFAVWRCFFSNHPVPFSVLPATPAPPRCGGRQALDAGAALAADAGL